RHAERLARLGRRGDRRAAGVSAQSGRDAARPGVSRAARASVQSDGAPGHSGARHGVMNGPIGRWMETSRGSGVILIVLLLAFWQFSALYIMKTPTWPPVTRIFEAWYENVADGTLIVHLLATLWRQMLGYWLAVLLGVVLGLAMGYYRVFYNLLEPLI